MIQKLFGDHFIWGTPCNPPKETNITAILQMRWNIFPSNSLVRLGAARWFAVMLEAEW